MSKFTDSFTGQFLLMQSRLPSVSPGTLVESSDFQQKEDPGVTGQAEDPSADCILNCSQEEGSQVPTLFPDLYPCEVGSSWPVQNPFEGSHLLGFSLSAVGTALASHRRGLSKDCKQALWSLVRSSGGDKPQRVPRDHIECLYRRRWAFLVFLSLRGWLRKIGLGGISKLNGVSMGRFSPTA